MHIYNIHFTIKADVNTTHFIEHTKALVEALIEKKLIQSATLNRLVDKANFAEMPDYHLAIYFKDADKMRSSFEIINAQFKNTHPHQSLMASISDFKVTFSKEV